MSEVEPNPRSNSFLSPRAAGDRCRLAADSDLLRVKEAAAFLRVSSAKMYELIRTGVVEAFRPGGTYRISREALVRYLNSTRL
jgi:DNA binding domain, excisionase family